jgi:N-(2-amino-2-carboxyethyl)-L-glutamate synthase
MMSHQHTSPTGEFSAIGNTPLVPLRIFSRDSNVQLYAKLEGLNPGGSSKDRAAFSMIESAHVAGDIVNGSIIIESSSGNMGIGLARACRHFGFHFICVTDARITAANARIISLYGGDLRIVNLPESTSASLLERRLELVKELVNTIPNSYWPNQYANPANPAAYHVMMEEIVVSLGRSPDYLLCPVSTCGTIRGCAEYIRRHRIHTKLIAVDSSRSRIYGTEYGLRHIPGLGAAIRPSLCDSAPSENICVSDAECIKGCFSLLKTEGLLVGGSSGGVAQAWTSISNTLPTGSVCVLIFPDCGDRYLDTIFSFEWISERFPDLAINLMGAEHAWNE